MDESGWLVERYIKNQLHYWCAGARGRGLADDWSTSHEWVTRFAREEDAMAVLLHICHGEDRVVEHKWTARAA
jgi:hypothetical protein